MIGVGLYVKNSLNAVAVYCEAFDLELGYHVMNEDGTYFHSELLKNGKAFLSVVESKINISQGNIVHLGITLDDKSSVEKAFNLLCEEGNVIAPLAPLPWTPCAGELVDKFGVLWYITAPEHRPPDDYDPNQPWDPSMYRESY